MGCGNDGCVGEGKTAIEERLAELRPLLTIDRLDREIIDLLIDRVLVFGEKDIEIVWLDSFSA